MDETLKLGAIGQIARHVSDVALSARWFQEKLGLPHLYTFGDLAFFDCGGTRLMLSKGDSLHNAILYFLVPDVRTAHVSLEAKGVVFIAAPHLIHRHEDGTEEWMAFFSDPDGQPLAIMSRTKPKA